AIDETPVLVGHSLENDLRALKISYNYIIDTSVLFGSETNAFKSSLKSLAFSRLNKLVQADLSGHDSSEDAKTALQLVYHYLTTKNTLKKIPKYLKF
ncbi:MAG: RNA exonuclease, partial [Paramarteilia canceri]